MKEKIYVEINGIRLGIVTEDGAEYVEQIARQLENQLNSMMRAQRNCTLIEASLFTAMNLESKCEEDEKRLRILKLSLQFIRRRLIA